MRTAPLARKFPRRLATSHIERSLFAFECEEPIAVCWRGSGSGSIDVVTVLETRNCSFRLDGDGFVHATMFDGATFELDDARAAVDMTWKVAGEKRLPVLVDTRGVRSQSRGARAYFMSEEVSRKLVAVALLVESPLSRVIANFFVRMGGEQHTPTRIFTDIAEARVWVRTFLS